MPPMAHKVLRNLAMQTYGALFLVLTFGIISSCSAVASTYDVYPDSVCQLSSADHRTECLTLSDVLSERDKYFTSNSILVFHDGDHILQGEVVSVSFISKFTLKGYSVNVSEHWSPTITCVNSSLSFSNQFLHISFISFNHCSISLWKAIVVVQNSRFENGRAVNGGALAVRSSSVHFTGVNSFAGNFAERTGGAIYADGSRLTFSGSVVFSGNMAGNGGAVSAFNNNILNFNKDSSFVNNLAENNGGAVYADTNNALSFSGKSKFISNTAKQSFGGALFTVNNNTLSFNGKSSFMNSAADRGGGAVFSMKDSSVTFNGNSSFMCNTVDGKDNVMNSYGGAVSVIISRTLVAFSGNSRFVSNTARCGGAVSVASGNTLIITGNSSFMNNTADYAGGAVYISKITEVQLFGNSSFMGNTAGSSGGAVFASNVKALSFSGENDFRNNTSEYGGAVFGYKGSTINFSGKNVLESNVAIRGGGIALLDGSIYLSEMVSLSFNIARFGGGAFIQDSTFESSRNIIIQVAGNEAMHGGGLFLESSNVKLQSSDFVENIAIHNQLEGGYGGAILARSSRLHFQTSFYFGNNSADFGGGLALSGSVLSIKKGTELSFIGNLAHRRGGAIFVEDNVFTSCAFDTASQNQIREACFFQMVEDYTQCFPYLTLPTPLQVNYIQPALQFHNNTANQSGNIIYGGLLESCVVCGGRSPTCSFALGFEVFQNISDYSGSDGYSSLSSHPYKVCICNDNVPNCDQREVNDTLYPGQMLATFVVAVGQMNGTVPSVIRAVSDDLITTSDFKETQPADNNQECNHVRYPMLSQLSQATASLQLYSDEPCSIFGYPLTFRIKFLPCPIGFTFSNQGTCVCDGRLQAYTHNCSIQTLTVSRLEGDSFWVGVEGSEKLVLHPHCPFDYCIKEWTDIPLNSTANYNGTDVQCANGRSGTLCGACQPGCSLALGSSRCLCDCSNGYLALLLVFVFAGVVLVAFLFLCRLTVAEGTLSGLIFYANVLAVNQTVFFPTGQWNLLTVFIAWLNLDLGIETCFFESLDTYYSTWLQFAFPIYIWAIVGAIIVLADRSVLVAKIIGSANPVAVLATLFLLSYTKLLRVIMTAFSFTILDYPDGESKYVWLYDGNIGYLDRHESQHIGLFLFSFLFLLFVFFPYTFLLLCGQWIQRKVWWLPSTWQLYLKSFLDANYGPYKHRHRYWTGLLLLLRFFMLLVATVINIRNPQDPFSNLLVIQVVCLVACCWDTVIRGLYKKWYLDLLEISFFVNLIVLVGGTYQVSRSGGNQAALVYTSVSVVFVTFIGIVSSAVVKRVKEKVAQYRRRAILQIANTVPGEEEELIQHEPAPTSQSGVTYSVLELVREDSDQTSGEIKLMPLAEETPNSNQ